MKIKFWSDKHPVLSYTFWMLMVGFAVAGFVQMNIWLGIC